MTGERKPEDSPLANLADAVADGTEVDWAAAESTAGTPSQRQLVQELRIVAELAALHRGVDHRPGRAADPAAPATWGPLQIRRRIGTGHFGDVFLAWDPALEREVALKILRGAHRSAAVVQEARLLAMVRHPNVVTVYGVDHHDGAVGFWMEFIDGLTLTQELAARGMLGAHEAALVGIDLCRAVAAVHKAGLLHRDIKVQNVMRDPGGRIVLMDFGAGEIRADRFTARGAGTGTPLYLAPELFAGGQASIASDIYSLGVVLYHLVTMQYPVEGNTIDAIEAAHARGLMKSLADARPELPGSFVRAVERALQHDPADRYRTSGAMQQQLVASLELATTSTSTSSHSVPPRPRPRTPSIAVLPFVNLGPDQDLEYFCNGLAEELLTGLGKVPGLRVASRTSSLAMKQTETDIRSICRQLGVDAVLEGTVRKAEDRLRISAQLVSAHDGCHLWSEGYDRHMTDVFAVQDEIAQSVVDRLKVTLAEVPRLPLIRRYTDNPRAYHLYLKGRFYWSRRYHGGLRTALQHFEQAIEEDAGYALAHAGLADAYAFLGFYTVQPPRSAFARARAAVERALAIDPELPEAHTSLALIRLGNDWDWAGAEREFTRALELDPAQTMARIYLSWLAVLLGDPARGVLEARRAQDIDPLSPLVNSGAAYTLFIARRYEEAVLECEKSLEIDPNFIVAVWILGVCRAQQSRLDEAIGLLEQAVSISGRATFYLGLLGNLYGRAGALDKAHALIEEIEALGTRQYVPPHCLAYIYAGLNDLDRAFEWHARAYEDGFSPFNYFSPTIENLHADPRHVGEMQRIGLPIEPRNRP